MLAPCISPLFVPGDRPERFEKAARTPADAIIIDFEDAVAPDRKDAARRGYAAGCATLDCPVIVRINAAGTVHHQGDLGAVVDRPPHAVMLPKAETRDDVLSVRRRLPPDVALILLIESCAGLATVRCLAQCDGVDRLAFGSVDMALDLDCAHAREPLAMARSELVFASRLAGLPAPLDGVTVEAKDTAKAEQDARYGRMMGFGGKMCIHPSQLEPVRSAFAPSDQDIAWARTVIAASDDGAALIDGMMIDKPVVERARRLLSRSIGESGAQQTRLSLS